MTHGLETDGSRIIHPELSYKLQGVFIDVSKKYGYLHKESVYQHACEEAIRLQNIVYTAQPRINICSLDTGKIIGTYIPDFLIENEIIVELKALKFLPQVMINQLIQYLKASKYELGFLVNFGTPKAQIIRKIYTNDRKLHIRE